MKIKVSGDEMVLTKGVTVLVCKTPLIKLTTALTLCRYRGLQAFSPDVCATRKEKDARSPRGCCIELDAEPGKKSTGYSQDVYALSLCFLRLMGSAMARRVA